MNDTSMPASAPPRIVMLPLDQIEIGARLRDTDEDYAQMIAVSMAANGPMTPIEVRDPGPDGGAYPLIAGAHRFRAAELAGIPALPAIVRQVGDLEARLREIDENLVRRELTALDRGTFLAERKTVYEELHPETKLGSNQHTAGFADPANPAAPRFTADIADKLGISERTVQACIARHRQIPPEIRRELANTPLANKAGELDALARLAPKTQKKVFAALIRADFGLSVANAVRRVDGVLEVVPNVDTQHYDRLLSAWRKASGAARRRFTDFLAQMGDAQEAA